MCSPRQKRGATKRIVVVVVVVVVSLKNIKFKHFCIIYVVVGKLRRINPTAYTFFLL